MPTPTLHDVHIDSALGNISIAYRNEQYIGELIFPRVPVQKKTDSYFVFGKDWFRDEAQPRAPGARAARGGYTVTTASYVCVEYAFAHPIPEEVERNADNPLRPRVEGTNYVTDKLLLAQEKRIAAKVMNSSGWTYSASPATQWSSDSADPYADIDNAINGIISVTGIKPNTAVMSWDVWRKLRNHPDLIDRVKYTRPGSLPMPSDLSTWFDIERILIGYAISDAGKTGQSASMSYVWGDDMWIGYVPATPSLMVPAAGYLLEWLSRQVRTYDEEQEHQVVIEARHSTAEVVSASDAGAIIYDVV